MKNRHILVTVPKVVHPDGTTTNDSISFELETDASGETSWPIALELVAASVDGQPESTFAGHVMNHAGETKVPVTGNLGAVQIAYCLARVLSAVVEGRLLDIRASSGELSRDIKRREEAGELKRLGGNCGGRGGADFVQALHEVVTLPGVRSALLVALTEDGIYNRHEFAAGGTREANTREACELVGGLEVAKAALLGPMRRRGGPSIMSLLQLLGSAAGEEASEEEPAEKEATH